VARPFGCAQGDMWVKSGGGRHCGLGGLIGDDEWGPAFARERMGLRVYGRRVSSVPLRCPWKDMWVEGDLMEGG